MKPSKVFAITAGCACAATAAAQPLNLADSSALNRFGFSFRPGFNIKADFSGLGGYVGTAPGPNDTSVSLDRNYDDGYNRVDASGNVGRMTGYWGYDNAGQTPAGLDAVVMSSSSSAATASSSDQDDGAQLGFEFSYNRRLGHIGKCAWGVELAFNYTDVYIKDRSDVYASVNRIEDSYSLGGITPPYDAPPAPAYRGTYNGPGPLISDIPTRTTHVLPNGAVSSGQRYLDAAVYGWRLGPFLDVPVSSRLALSFSAGLAIAYVYSDFSFTENVAISGVGSESSSGNGSSDETMCGYYLSGLVSYAVCEQANLFAGVQFQDVGTFDQTVAGRTASLDLGKSIFMTVGMSWSF